MKSQKSILFGFLALFFIGYQSLIAQLELPYTTTILNGNIINPAHSEKDSATFFTFLNRDQWNGIVGAPKSQMISASVPFLDNNHVGANLFRNTAGVSERFTFDLFYNYKIRLDDAYIALGILASYQQERRDFTKDGLLFSDPISIDAVLEEGIISLSSFNTGVGAHYERKNFNFGVSWPRILGNRLGLFGSEKVRNNTPIFAYTNYYYQIRKGFVIRNRLNLQLDTNQYSLLQYFLGFNYRNNLETGIQLNSQITNGFKLQSLDVIAGIHIHKNFTIGVSYGVPLSVINEITPGNFEVNILYLLPQER